MNDKITICAMKDGFCVTDDGSKNFDLAVFANEKKALEYCVSLGYSENEIERTEF